MSIVIQAEPKGATESTPLLKSPTSTSLSTSINSVGSFSELNLVAPVLTFRIKRQDKRICCNTSRHFQVRDDVRNELLLTATQENSICSASDVDYEDLHVYDMNDDLMFSIEFEETTGYLSTQMKFSVVSSTKLGLGTVTRIWSFMESPRFEILNWDKEHLFSIGPPKISGIKSYDYKRKYDIISNDGKIVSHTVQEKVAITLKFIESVETLPIRDKILILAFGFILDFLKHEEI